MPHRGRGLLSLPESLLEAVFSKCSQSTRAAVLPLVCRTFRTLLAGPSACLWRGISLELDLSRPGEPERAANFLAWLSRHGSLSKKIEMDMWSSVLVPAQLPAALGELFEQTLSGCLASCEYLRLRWGGQQLVVGEWISAATSLTCLALSGHGITLCSHLSALTCLAHLELSTLSDDGPLLEAGCLPPSITRLCCVPAPGELAGEDLEQGPVTSQLPDQLLALPHLQYLDVSESWFQGQHLAAAMPHLTGLTSLALDKCELPDGLPSDMSQLTRLRVLSFDGCIMLEAQQMQLAVWTVLANLTGLMSLSLSNCGIAHLPPSVAALPRMQHLYLEYNTMRCLPPGPYLRNLRVLSTDWEALLRSHKLLLREAPHLHKLALGSMSLHAQDGEGLTPLSSSQQLLDSLRGHSSLREILLIVRPTHVTGAFSPVMDAILGLGNLRPQLTVRPIEHDAFFVEDAPEEPEGGVRVETPDIGALHDLC